MLGYLETVWQFEQKDDIDNVPDGVEIEGNLDSDLSKPEPEQKFGQFKAKNVENFQENSIKNAPSEPIQDKDDDQFAAFDQNYKANAQTEDQVIKDTNSKSDFEQEDDYSNDDFQNDEKNSVKDHADTFENDDDFDKVERQNYNDTFENSKNNKEVEQDHFELDEGDSKLERINAELIQLEQEENLGIENQVFYTYF